jgi:aspartate racemase
MKTIGLIGGTSWISTIDYYRIINTTVNERLGGNESARIILHSVNYGEIVELTHHGNWDAICNIVSKAAGQAERAGAGCILLCANTMHQIAERVQQSISIPLIHIADATATIVHHEQIDTVLLLGTRYTMAADFYPDKLAARNINMILPGIAAREFINETIYNEMGKGVFLPETKKSYLDIMKASIALGAKGVILGCTEIPMLLRPEECPLPVFDTTRIHATAAVDFALND